MKKILFMSGAVLLMAAGCNSTQQAAVQTPVTQNTNSAPVPTQKMMQGTATSSMTQSTAAMSKASSTPAKPVAQAQIVLKLGSGQYLTASNGMTLYTSSSDSTNMSNCSGSCATNWPPYIVAAGTQAGAAAGISGKLGTITRTDGSTQVTYKNMPLYFWIHDAKPGDTTGNGVGPFVVAAP